MIDPTLEFDWFGYKEGPRLTIEAFKDGYRWLFPDGTPTDISATTKQEAIRLITLGHGARLLREWIAKHPEPSK